MDAYRELEADVLRDLSEFGGGDAADEDMPDPPRGQCGIVHRDSGRSYTVRPFDSWSGIANRIIRNNPESKLSVSQYRELMRSDARNKGKPMWPGTVLYLPPIFTASGRLPPRC